MEVGSSKDIPPSTCSSFMYKSSRASTCGSGFRSRDEQGGGIGDVEVDGDKQAKKGNDIRNNLGSHDKRLRLSVRLLCSSLNTIICRRPRCLFIHN